LKKLFLILSPAVLYNMMAVNCDYNSGQGQVCGNECFDIVKSSQTYTVPCSKQVNEVYTVQVPKTKAYTVNKQVPYIDYETKTKQVPYQYVDRQTVTRNVPGCRTIPMIKSVCTSVPARRRGFGFGRQCYVKKKCPRTVYVRQRCCKQRKFCQSIPRIGWKSVQENVPVQKFRNETEVKYKTETVPERRVRTRTVTKMVNKTVPVYNVVKKPEPPVQQPDTLVRTIPAVNQQTVLPPLTINTAPPIVYQTSLIGNGAAVETSGGISETSAVGMNSYDGYTAAQQGQVFLQGYDQTAAMTADFNRIDKSGDGMLSYGEVRFDSADLNKDGVLDMNEYQKGYGIPNEGMYTNGCVEKRGEDRVIRVE